MQTDPPGRGKGTEMQYTVRHTCGHLVSVALSGPSIDRNRRLAWLRTQPCQACWREREQASAEAAAEAAGLPALIGTPKQIAWAVRIRQDLLDKVQRKIDELQRLDEAAGSILRTAMRRIAVEAEASRWIDRRDATAAELLLHALTPAEREALDRVQLPRRGQ